MITVTIYKDSGQYAGFTARGHAGYAEEGFDIVCAAASALTINCLNSLEAFTEDSFRGEEKDGFVSCRFPQELSEQGRLLMDSMVLGLTDIENSYGQPYIRIEIKEV